MKRYLFAISMAAVMLASCGSHKKASIASTEETHVVTPEITIDNSAILKKDYVRKVNANATNVTNIVSKIDFSLAANGKDVSVDGKIYMRRNEVIRIVLAPFGLMEVGRLEFAPDYVLVVDRIHKEYVKATYNDLDFLKANGLDFYSLQALFWNELFLPGKQQISDETLNKFDVDLAASKDRKVTMKSGKLEYVWTTDPETTLVNAATVNYASGTPQASTAQWSYGKFVALNSKQFPLNQNLTFQSKSLKAGGKMELDIKMKKISTDSDWDAKTSVSSKYAEIKANDIIKKLMSF